MTREEAMKLPQAKVILTLDEKKINEDGKEKETKAIYNFVFEQIKNVLPQSIFSVADGIIITHGREESQDFGVLGCCVAGAKRNIKKSEYIKYISSLGLYTQKNDFIGAFI